MTTIEGAAASTGPQSDTRVSETKGVDAERRLEGTKDMPAPKDSGFYIGNDAGSISSALNIDPVAIGKEVALARPLGTETQLEPLHDTQGVLRHWVSPAEAKHYADLQLTPQRVGTHDALVSADIDWNRPDPSGSTNLERARSGRPPLDRGGRPYDLHHIGQAPDGMLAELTIAQHRGPGVFKVLHAPGKASDIHRPEFHKERADYWRARAAEVQQ